MEKKISKEELDRVFSELYLNQKHKIGIEDNGPYGYTIHLGNGQAIHTNIAGVEMFHKAMQEYGQKEYTEAEIQQLIKEANSSQEKPETPNQ